MFLIVVIDICMWKYFKKKTIINIKDNIANPF